ncbi:UPF0171-domain-containing protein [Trichodelitschia bisporula]|uniref:Nitrogen permease regulator 3 n=1 Tax=Trichodelitschia bisporula TaxID=703511 RepID=A0A6G1I0F1_9PEZI|nr:UPF0171-domain-containing protein [Trichodelitschia bisporula]
MPAPVVLPPNPCLVAILLVIKTRSGSRLVFHYPPSPSADKAAAGADTHWHSATSTYGEEDDDSAWSSHSDSPPSDDNASKSSRAGSRASGRPSRNDTGGSGKSARARAALGRREVEEDVDSEDLNRDGNVRVTHKDDVDETHALSDPDWNSVLGFGADGLSRVLTPGRSFNKRRFEVGIDQLMFIGAPMFIREDGQWKKKKKRRRRRASRAVQDPGSDADVDEAVADVGSADVHASPPEPEFDVSQVSGFEAGYGHVMSGAASDISENSHDGDMDMFNVVFVMNPPALEHHLRVEEMYDHVLKKFAKELKFEQAQRGYVFKESREILSMKEKGRENRAPMYTLWPNILGTSSLAKAIAIIFDQISNNKIAHVNLDSAFDMSFQIPQTISTPYISTATEPQLPGLWLTTATLHGDDEEPALSEHSALLLLDDQDTLLKEVEGDQKELSRPLSFFIRNLTPTKSLHKLSQAHAMPIRDVQFLARHLIYWRRARAIPPLRWRDTYIVSPNADMHALPAAIKAFATRFQALPSLPQFLQSLSGTPKPYASLMPSRDHRSVYMDILAWLMRGGWVTQLRTFGWVRVPPEVKAAVAANAKTRATRSASGRSGQSDDASDRERTPVTPFRREGREPDVPEFVSTLSPRLTAHRPGPPSESGSVSSGRSGLTATTPMSPLQQPQRIPHRPSRLHINQTAVEAPPSPSLGSQPVSSPSEGPPEPKFTASIISSPQRAQAVESQWLEYIGSHFEDPDLREMWPVLLRYFDGRRPLEEIPVREGLKKKRVAPLLGKLAREGWLVTVRHW